jgi:hypothetical protein
MQSNSFWNLVETCMLVAVIDFEHKSRLRTCHLQTMWCDSIGFSMQRCSSWSDNGMGSIFAGVFIPYASQVISCPFMWLMLLFLSQFALHDVFIVYRERHLFGSFGITMWNSRVWGWKLSVCSLPAQMLMLRYFLFKYRITVARAFSRQFEVQGHVCGLQII